MDALAADAFKVINLVESQQGVVGQVVVSLENEQGISSNSELLLELDQSTSVFVVLAQMIE